MRYILDSNGYIEAVAFGSAIICNNNTCTEYVGTIPEGYTSLTEWAENANIRAYKIISNNLAYDSVKDAELQAQWAIEQGNNTQTIYSTEEQVIGTWLGKPAYRKVITTSEYINVNESMNIPHNIQNLEHVIKCDGMLCWGGLNMPFPTHYENQEREFVINYVDTTNVKVTSFNESWGSYSVYIILEYTKTTD